MATDPFRIRYFGPWLVRRPGGRRLGIRLVVEGDGRFEGQATNLDELVEILRAAVDFGLTAQPTDDHARLKQCHGTKPPT